MALRRTNIEIDEDLIGRVMKRYGLPTRKAAVDYALRSLVEEPMTVREALDMEGRGWGGDLSELRDEDPVESP